MKKIGIIGCGNMGEAILKGIVSGKVVSHRDISVSDMDSAKLDRIKDMYKVKATFNNSMVAGSCDIIIIAVKPCNMEGTLTNIAESLDKKKVIISVAAGVTIKSIRSHAGDEAAIVRAMPNMPALIKMGFTALAFSDNVSKAQSKAALAIFNSIGEAVTVNEKDLDAITAISGSGPAYFFYLVEVLIAAGVKLGLKHDVAEKAAIKTALGSADLLNKFGNEASTLRKRVTSKGGTTEAAFKVFKKRHLKDILASGIKAAQLRSKKLSRG